MKTLRLKYGNTGDKNNFKLMAAKDIVFFGDAGNDSEFVRINVSQIVLFNTFLNEKDLDGLGISMSDAAVFTIFIFADNSNKH